MANSCSDMVSQLSNIETDLNSPRGPMADVLLTHSYFLHFDPKERRAMMPYPPLGTLYAASSLRSAGITVALHDVMLSLTEDEIINSIERHAPKLVVIYDDQFNYLTKMCLVRMREAAFRMAKLAKDRHCKVIVYGSDASDHLENYLSEGADFVICGEAEATLTELVLQLLNGTETVPNAIAGLAFMESGELIRTAPRNVVENLDLLPFPAWDLVEFDRYREIWKKRHGYFSLNMVTTRGCPFHCNWCAKPIYGQVYHSRSPENVVEEMRWLREIAQPDHIWFADDIFGLKPGWISRFDEVVKEQDVSIPFKCLSRVDLLLKEDNIRHLRSAGCKTVWVGAESGSQKILDAMEKGTTVEQIQAATRLLHTHDINVGFFLQYGYPGETLDDIEKTLEMVRRFRPDEIGISVSYPLPGTKFYERVRQELQRKQNWTDSGDLDLMFLGTYPPDFYRILHRLTHKKFRIWEARDLAATALMDPRTLDRAVLKKMVKSVYHSLSVPGLERKLKGLEKTWNYDERGLEHVPNG
jgi:anaerobic magnesium-protoporphyrin IX monomethyl ester cyclase